MRFGHVCLYVYRELCCFNVRPITTQVLSLYIYITHRHTYRYCLKYTWIYRYLRMLHVSHSFYWVFTGHHCYQAQKYTHMQTCINLLLWSNSAAYVTYVFLQIYTSYMKACANSCIHWSLRKILNIPVLHLFLIYNDVVIMTKVKFFAWKWFLKSFKIDKKKKMIIDKSH